MSHTLGAVNQQALSLDPQIEQLTQQIQSHQQTYQAAMQGMDNIKKIPEASRLLRSRAELTEKAHSLQQSATVLTKEAQALSDSERSAAQLQSRDTRTLTESSQSLAKVSEQLSALAEQQSRLQIQYNEAHGVIEVNMRGPTIELQQAKDQAAAAQRECKRLATELKKTNKALNELSHTSTPIKTGLRTQEQEQQQKKVVSVLDQALEIKAQTEQALKVAQSQLNSAQQLDHQTQQDPLKMTSLSAETERLSAQLERDLALIRQVEALLETKAQQEKRVDAASREHSQATSRLQGKQASFDQIRQLLAPRQRTADTAKAELAQNKARTTSLQKEREQLVAKMKKLNLTIETRTAQATSLSATLSITRGRLQSTQSALDTAKKEHAAIIKQCETNQDIKQYDGYSAQVIDHKEMESILVALVETRQGNQADISSTHESITDKQRQTTEAQARIEQLEADQEVAKALVQKYSIAMEKANTAEVDTWALDECRPQLEAFKAQTEKELSDWVKDTKQAINQYKQKLWVHTTLGRLVRRVVEFIFGLVSHQTKAKLAQDAVQQLDSASSELSESTADVSSQLVDKVNLLNKTWFTQAYSLTQQNEDTSSQTHFPRSCFETSSGRLGALLTQYHSVDKPKVTSDTHTLLDQFLDMHSTKTTPTL